MADTFTPAEREIMQDLFGIKEVLDESKGPNEYFTASDADITGTSYTSVVGHKPPKGMPDIPVEIFKPDDWSENMRAFIPKFNPLYHPDPMALYSLLVGWHLAEPVLIYGPTGSGKTSLVEYASAMVNRPYIRINGRGDMESGPIFGQPSVEIDEETKLNVYKWNDGIVTEGARGGAVLNFDEPFATPPEIQIGMNSLLEDDGVLVLSDKAGQFRDKIVKPDARFRIVYSDNTGGLGDQSGAFAGVHVQNTSTLDRFQTIIFLTYLDKKRECVMLKYRFPEMHATITRNMVSFANLVRENYINGDLSLTMSPRTLISWSEKALLFQDVKRSLDICFRRKFKDDGELATLNNHYRTVFGENW